jgi:hypothetical protein
MYRVFDVLAVAAALMTPAERDFLAGFLAAFAGTFFTALVLDFFAVPPTAAFFAIAPTPLANAF